MIEIRIDGSPADLNQDATLQLDFQNPDFYLDTFQSPQKAILPLLPNTPTNRSLINYFNLLQSTTVNTRQRVDNYSNGHLLSSGIFIIQEASDEGFTGGVVENLGDFFGSFQSQLITSLALGTVTIPASITPTVSISGSLAYAFPSIINPSYYSGTDGSYSGRMNNYVTSAYTANTPFVPQFFLHYIITRIAALTGVVINGDFFTDTQAQALLIINTRQVQPSDTVDINLHLPDLTIAELFLELRKIAYLDFNFNTTTPTLTIRLRQTAISQSTIHDWTSKAEKQTIKVPEENRRLAFAFTPDTNDAHQKANPNLFLEHTSTGDTDASIQKITSKFTSLHKDTTTGLGIMDQAGITDTNSQLDKSFSPRLAYYQLHGGIPTAHFISPNGLEQLTPQYILNTHYAQLVSQKNNGFYIKKNILLTESDIAKLNFSDTYYIAGLYFALVSAKPTLPITTLTECLFFKI